MEAMIITNLRLPKEILAQIDEKIAESGGLIRSRNQFIREAVIERLIN